MNTLSLNSFRLFRGLNRIVFLVLLGMGSLRLQVEAQNTPDPLPVVSLIPIQLETAEPTPTTRIAPARFLIQRKGDSSQHLSLFFEFGGTATLNVDYQVSGKTIDMAPGVVQLEFLVTPLADDLVEGPETVVVKLIPPLTDNIPNYVIDANASELKLLIRDGTNDGTSKTSVVSIFAETSVTSEPSPLALVAPGVIRVSRTAPLDTTLRIVLAATGTAQNKVDYRLLSRYGDMPLLESGDANFWIAFHPGEESIFLNLVAQADSLVEGDETVVLQVQPPIDALAVPTYTVDPTASVARFVIHDQNIPQVPTLIIDQPLSGATFSLGAPIDILATAVDPAGYIPHVDFLADGKKIGESTITFIVAPKPGTVIQHSFSWKDAPIGTHILLVQSIRADGTLIQSKPVTIEVQDSNPIPVVGVFFLATPDAYHDADYAPGYFEIRRSGSTARPLSVRFESIGTATPGLDYEALPPLVVIPAGESSYRVKIEAIDDKFPEQGETVGLRLLPYIDAILASVLPDTQPYTIDPAHESASEVLFDNDLPSQIATLELTAPTEGQQFLVGEPIVLKATAVDQLADIRRVEFYDAFRLIGVSVQLTKDAVIPGKPRYHEYTWLGASLGSHEIFACALDSEGKTVLSKTVHVQVVPDSPQVVVAVQATDPIGYEQSPNGEGPKAAVFTILRVSGPLDVDVNVSYSLQGTAQNGVDYQLLKNQVLLPKGSKSVDIRVVPIPDKAIEGIESVVMQLEPVACVQIFPMPPDCYAIGVPSTAKVEIQDGSTGGNQAPVVEILQPTQGKVVDVNAAILIHARASDPDGWVVLVQFFADGLKIGESIFPGHGKPASGARQFHFVWKGAAPGKHLLTARAIDNQQAAAESTPVEIQVGPKDPQPAVTVFAWDAQAVEPHDPGSLDTATFQIVRTGSTATPLTVFLEWSGTAIAGKDYETPPTHVLIPEGRSSVFVTVTPIPDSIVEPRETIVLQIVDSPLDNPNTDSLGSTYWIGKPSLAIAVLIDPKDPANGSTEMCHLLPGSWMDVCFASTTGTRYRIETSEDLITWATTSFTTATGDYCHFVDTASTTSSSRFYRAIPILASEDPVKP